MSAYFAIVNVFILCERYSLHVCNWLDVSKMAVSPAHHNRNVVPSSQGFITVIAYKGKRLSSPHNGPWRHRGGAQVQLYSLFNLCASWGWMVNTTPLSLYPQQRDSLPIEQEDGWTSDPVWTCAESLPPPGFDPWTVKPATSRYTDYAIQVHVVYHFDLLCSNCVMLDVPSLGR